MMPDGILGQAAMISVVAFLVLHIYLSAYLMLKQRKKQEPYRMPIPKDVLHDTGSGKLWLEQWLGDDDGQ